MNPTLHQFVPTLDGGAVGAHVIEVQRTLRAAGWESEIFSEMTKAPYEGQAHPFTDYAGTVAAHPDDVLLYHAAIGSVVADWLMSERRPRLVIDYHNITPPSWFEGWEPDQTYGLGWGRAQLRRLARRCRLAWADSAFNAGELAAVGMPRSEILPILMPADALGAPGEPDVVARAGSTPGARWVFVGRLAPHKRQHLIIAALAAYRRLYDPHARLTLVGGPSSVTYESALRRFVADLAGDDRGLAEAVTITGPVSDAERNAHYAAADVFVCLSAHEGFCVPLLEAWHHRVPVVAYGAAAVPETLGDAGVLLADCSCLPVAAAVARVCNDPLLAAGLRDAGTRRLDRYSPERTRSRLLDLAGGLLSGDLRPPGLARFRP